MSLDGLYSKGHSFPLRLGCSYAVTENAHSSTSSTQHEQAQGIVRSARPRMQDRVGRNLAVLGGDLNGNGLGHSRVGSGVTTRTDIRGVCGKDETELPTRHVHAGRVVLRERDVG